MQAAHAWQALLTGGAVTTPCKLEASAVPTWDFRGGLIDGVDQVPHLCMGKVWNTSAWQGGEVKNQVASGSCSIHTTQRVECQARAQRA